MPEPHRGAKRLTLLGTAMVFAPTIFVIAAFLLDWVVKLRSSLWLIVEFLAFAAILVWRRQYVRRIVGGGHKFR